MHYKREDLQKELKAGEDPELDEAFRSYRDSVRAAAEKPEFFWRRQHNSIVANLKQSPSRFKYRRLVWVPAALAIFLCLFFFVETSKAPTPDIATGSDQDLLIDVERALNQACPDALAPAGLLDFESRQNQNSEIRRKR